MYQNHAIYVGLIQESQECGFFEKYQNISRMYICIQWISPPKKGH